eukprot:1160060-Pelagomonas_calceolata.AAC.3
MGSIGRQAAVGCAKIGPGTSWICYLAWTSKFECFFSPGALYWKLPAHSTYVEDHFKCKRTCCIIKSAGQKFQAASSDLILATYQDRMGDRDHK